MRKYLRNIARHNMKQAGIERFNKTGYDPVTGKEVKSYFSRKWRDYI